MREFIAAVLVALVLAMAAGAVLETYVQEGSTSAYARPGTRV
jgi:hypothetical protein